LNASLGGGDASEIAKFIAQNQYQLSRSYILQKTIRRADRFQRLGSPLAIWLYRRSESSSVKCHGFRDGHASLYFFGDVFQADL